MEEKINYKLRDWGYLARFWGCRYQLFIEDGEVLAIEENELPVKLPNIENFNDSSSLKNIEDWKNTICPKSGMKAIRETDTFDTFLNRRGIILGIVMQD